VLEQRDRLGGVLRTVDLAGVPYDVGAEAFLARRPEVPALLDELGLCDELVHPGRAAATVRAAGTTVPLPAGTLLGVPTGAARLDGVLSPAGLARVAAERDRPLEWTAGADVALGALLRERFGDEPADRLADPLLGGVYAGRVDALGLRATLPALATALDAGAPSLTAAADRAVGPASSAFHPGEFRLPPRRVPHSTSVGPPAPVFGALRRGYATLVDALAAGDSTPSSRAAPVGTPSSVPAGSGTVAPAARTVAAARPGCTSSSHRPSSSSRAGTSARRARNASAPTS